MNGQEYNEDTPMFVPKQSVQKNGTTQNNVQKTSFLPKVEEGEELETPIFQPKTNPNVVFSRKTENTTPSFQPKNTNFGNTQKIKVDFGQEEMPSFEPKNTNFANSQKPKVDFGQEEMPQSQNTYQSFEANENIASSNTDVSELLAKQEEILNQLRSNNLTISKLQREFKQVSSENTALSLQKNIDDIIGHIRTNSLYLSKLERKYGQLSMANSAGQAQEQMFEQLLNLMRTNNLYLSKLERKVLELESNSGNNQDSQELLQQIRSNTLQLSKIDRKANEILHSKSDVGFNPNHLNSIEQKLDAVLAQKQEEVLPMQDFVKELQEQKQLLRSMGNNINHKIDNLFEHSNQSNDNASMTAFLQNMERNIMQKLDSSQSHHKAEDNSHLDDKIDRLANQIDGLSQIQDIGLGDKLENLQKKIEDLSIGSSEPQQSPLGDILNNLMETNQQLSGMEHKISNIESEQNNEVLVRNIKSNNLYLSRLERQIAELTEHLQNKNI